MRLDEARMTFQRELAECERHAMFVARGEVLHYLTEVECRAGNGSQASLHATEVWTLLEESGEVSTEADVILGCRASAAALLGDVERARDFALEGLRVAESISDRFTAAWHSAILGFLDVSMGDYPRAVEDLDAATRFLDNLDSAEPSLLTSMPDLIEALVAVGRYADAERRIERLEARAGARSGPWAVAVAARGRALLAAASGDAAGAEAPARRSIAVLDELGLTFDAARSRLVLGQVHRRTKKKRVAREQLEAARDTFVGLGARLWADRAEGELARIGGRRSSPFELTETEQRIAALVAQGRTNQETADALFVSPSTVQANLKHIYQKLGVRSRTELAARIRGDS
jgi:DNA-binding CsgD family transcriptional regulator